MPQDSYPISDLYLFPVYQTREDYRKRTGKRAPAFDPSKPVRTWEDTGPGPETRTYFGFDWSDRTFKTVQMSPGPVNLPGPYEFDAYVIAPTKATVVSTYDGSRQPLNPMLLSTAEDAKRLAQEIERDTGIRFEVVEDPALSGPFRHEFPPEEKRRFFSLQYGDYRGNVGILMSNRHGLGVDRPGKWVFQAKSGLVFQHAYLEEWPRPGHPTVTFYPTRGLQPGEKLVVTPFGARIQATRTAEDVLREMHDLLDELGVVLGIDQRGE
jgi:hypothetical protein